MTIGGSQGRGGWRPFQFLSLSPNTEGANMGKGERERCAAPRSWGSLLGKAASFLRLNRQRGPEGGLSLKHQARLSSVCSEGFGQRL